MKRNSSNEMDEQFTPGGAESQPGGRERDYIEDVRPVTASSSTASPPSSAVVLADAGTDIKHEACDDEYGEVKDEYGEDGASSASSRTHGVPDIDHHELGASVPGHQLDLELGKNRDSKELRRMETLGSVKSKVSRVLSVIGRRSTHDRIAGEPIPTSDLDRHIVGWDGEHDPEMPLNFPPKIKWMIVGLVSTITVLTPFASSILSPGISAVNRDFDNDNLTIGSLTVSIYLLGYVIGPLFLAPLSEMYGRRPVLCGANIFFCVWQIGCALAPSIEALIVFRFLTGIGGSGCLTLGAGFVADLFRAEERGFAMGIYTLGPIIGPTIGPLIGGFLSQTVGWRWDFWIVLIAGVSISVLIEFFGRETNPRVLMDRKVRRLRRELDRQDLRSCYETGLVKSHRQILLGGLVRPLKMLTRSPLVFFLSLYIAFAYGVLYLLFTTITMVFRQTYDFSVGMTGLVYLALGLGNLLGWAFITTTTDRDVVRRTRKNGGVFEPEMRLPTTIYFGFLLPVTFFWYGWSAYYKVHWIAPVLSLIPFSTGIMGLFLPITTYLVDCYPDYAASVVAANTVFRSLVGMLLPLAGPIMYERLGLGWGNSVLGFLSVAMIPVPVLIYRYGRRLRMATNLDL